MTARNRFFALSLATILVVLFSAVHPLIARADDGAPPPPDPTQTETQPASDATDLAPAPTQVPDVLAQAPEDTQVVVLDAQGESVPLGTEQAAAILAAGDPMWCPAGVLPGGDGCTPGFTTFTGDSGLLPYLQSNSADFTGAGTIYVATNYDSSLEATPIFIDGGLGGYGLGDLTVQGGWDFGSNATAGTSSFNTSLNILNWGYDVTLNDLSFGNTGSPVSLLVNAAGNIQLNNVTVENNDGEGAILDNVKGYGSTIAINHSRFNNNQYDGLQAWSSGDITLLDVTASGNGERGAVLSNSDGPSVSPTFVCVAGPCDFAAPGISVSSSQFNDNGWWEESYEGLNVSSYGLISLADVIANSNAWDGIVIHNGSSGLGSAAPLESLPGSSADVSLANVTASNNASVGAEIYSTAAVSISGSHFDSNVPLGEPGGSFFLDGVGAVIQTDGPVTISSSTFNGNGVGGLFSLNFSGDSSFSSIQASNNGLIGAVIMDITGNIHVDSSTFSGNGSGAGGLGLGDGLVVETMLGSADVNCSNFTGNSGYGMEMLAGQGSVLVTNGDVFSANGSGDVNTNGAPRVDNPTAECGSGGHFTALPWRTIHVAGGEDNPLQCTQYAGTVLILPNGDQVMLPCPNGDLASLAALAKENLPGALDEQFGFLSALSVDVSPALTGSMTVGFTIPAGQQGTSFSIMHWDGTKWVDLGGVQRGGLFVVDTTLTGPFILVSK